MIIRQKEDATGEIIFSDQEIEILNKHKKLELSQEFLKHFMNLFIKVFFDFTKKMDEEHKSLLSQGDQEIKVKKPKED